MLGMYHLTIPKAHLMGVRRREAMPTIWPKAEGLLAPIKSKNRFLLHVSSKQFCSMPPKGHGLHQISSLGIGRERERERVLGGTIWVRDPK